MAEKPSIGSEIKKAGSGISKEQAFRVEPTGLTRGLSAVNRETNNKTKIDNEQRRNDRKRNNTAKQIKRSAKKAR